MNNISSGGIITPKEINYATPQGPTNQMRQGPGLGGTNCGNAGSQSCDTTPRSSGSPGLHGVNKGMGTNRKG